ncbi:IS607 family transposase [Pasteuria penetrans]|uniref:IS607 family transposase n=1 Tax=Pasteuria penetrans TaxID=86005 RepID=UPI000FA37976|nr:IS607 family transposase [Pasteuria penetrans]
MGTHYTPARMAKLLGVSVATLQRWDRSGVLKAHRSPTNRRYYTHQQYLQYTGAATRPGEGKTIAYLRVAHRKGVLELQAQKERIRSFCAMRGWWIHDWISEFGSAMDWKRPLFGDLMLAIERGEVCRLILVHRDRALRYGFSWFHGFCERHGTEVVILHDDWFSTDEEFVGDFIRILREIGDRLKGMCDEKKWLHGILLREVCRVFGMNGHLYIDLNHKMGFHEKNMNQVQGAESLYEAIIKPCPSPSAREALSRIVQNDG